MIISKEVVNNLINVLSIACFKYSLIINNVLIIKVGNPVFQNFPALKKYLPNNGFFLGWVVKTETNWHVRQGGISTICRWNERP